MVSRNDYMISYVIQVRLWFSIIWNGGHIPFPANLMCPFFCHTRTHLYLTYKITCYSHNY